MSLPFVIGDRPIQGNFDAIERGLPIQSFDHAPTDDDFPLPVDGLLAIDSTGPTLYMRSGDAWVVVGP